MNTKNHLKNLYEISKREGIRPAFKYDLSETINESKKSLKNFAILSTILLGLGLLDCSLEGYIKYLGRNHASGRNITGHPSADYFLEKTELNPLERTIYKPVLGEK